jgi:hypothetical protein
MASDLALSCNTMQKNMMYMLVVLYGLDQIGVRVLTDGTKAARIMAGLCFLQYYAADRNRFLYQVANNNNKTWHHYCTPTSKKTQHHKDL